MYQKHHDFDDFKRLTDASDEIHSFVGSAVEGEDRLYNAISSISDDQFPVILRQRKAVYVIILADEEGDRPLSVEEVKRLADFHSELPEDCDFVWGVHNQPGIGNAVKAIVLIAI